MNVQNDFSKYISIEPGVSWEAGKLFRFAGRFEIQDFDIIAQAADRAGVSDIDIQVGEPIWFDHYGKRTRATSKPLTANDVADLMRELYDRNGPSIVNMQGRPLDIAYVVRPLADVDRKLRLRVNMTSGRNPQSVGSILSDGAQITCRVLPGVPRTFADMNVPAIIVEQFRKRSGVLMVTGPTGSGKSTLMAAGVRHMGENEAESIKFLEYSAPIEFVYDGIHFPHSFIHQVEVGRDIRLRADEGGARMVWAACVANAMRRKPDVMIIGEARDAATIEGVVLAANTGHGVITTMHTVGVAETVRRAIMAIPADQRAGVGVDLIDISNFYITQLLVPKIGGGRVPVREYMVFDAAARRRIIEAPMEMWTQVIQQMMIRGEVECARMIDSAGELFEAGDISEQSYEMLALRQKHIDRSVEQHAINPDAPAQNLDGLPIPGIPASEATEATGETVSEAIEQADPGLVMAER